MIRDRIRLFLCMQKAQRRRQALCKVKDSIFACMLSHSKMLSPSQHPRPVPGFSSCQAVGCGDFAR